MMPDMIQAKISASTRGSLRISKKKKSAGNAEYCPDKNNQA